MADIAACLPTRQTCLSFSVVSLYQGTYSCSFLTAPLVWRKSLRQPLSNNHHFKGADGKKITVRRSAPCFCCLNDPFQPLKTILPRSDELFTHHKPIYGHLTGPFHRMNSIFKRPNESFARSNHGFEHLNGSFHLLKTASDRLTAPFAGLKHSFGRR